MSDLTAGSTAARQLQQNIVGAQYDSANLAAAAEEKQLQLQQERLKPEEARLKLDQDRLKALYAPAKAATQQAEDTYKLQEQMNRSKSAETKALFDDAEYKADTESTGKLKEWMKSDEGIKATDIQRLEKAAQFKSEVGLTKQAAALYTQIENINTKEIANKAKELTAANESIASARALIKNVPDEDVAGYIKRLPDNLQKTITDRIGVDNWEKLTGVQKKDVLETLFQNAKQQVAMQVKEVEKEKAVAVAEETTARSNYRADKQAESRGRGNGGDNTKQDAQNFSNVMKVDERLEKASLKGLEALDKKVATAEKAMVGEKAKWFNSTNADAASTAYTQAVAERDKYVKQQLEKRIKVVESAPNYSGKQTYVDSLRAELSLYGPAGEPPPAKEGAAAPVSAAASPTPVVVAPTVKYRTPEQFAKDTNADPNISKEAKASMIARYTAGYPDAIAAQKATSNKYTVDNPAKPTSKAEYDALPPGSIYIQDGATKQKPGGKTAEPAPTSKVAEPAVAATPAEPVMTDAEKQAKAAKNREKNLSVSTNKPVEPAVVLKDKGNMRPDGTAKGTGYLGVLKASDGSDVTEYSMSTGDVKVKGKEIDFPTIVPTLTKEEVNLMLTDIIPNNKRIPDAIVNKAIDHAKKRIKEGKSVFANTEDYKKEKSTAETLRELADMKQKGDALKKANDKKEKDLKETEKRIAKLKQLAGE